MVCLQTVTVYLVTVCSRFAFLKTLSLTHRAPHAASTSRFMKINPTLLFHNFNLMSLML